MAERKSFVVHLELIEQLEMLNTDQIGEIFMAMCIYVRDGTDPRFEDPLLKMLFSVVKSQLDRDAEKWEETCKKNAANGKKGGRPKKTERFSEKPKKTERFFQKPKKADNDSDSDSVCECDCEHDHDDDPVCDSVCDCERDCECDCDSEPECAGADNTAHTTHTAQPISLQEVLDLAKKLGYDWDLAEAQEFLAYNIDKGRKKGWAYAVKKWEENRRKRSVQRKSSRKDQSMSDQEIEEMNDYMSLVNRFAEGEEG